MIIASGHSRKWGGAANKQCFPIALFPAFCQLCGWVVILKKLAIATPNSTTYQSVVRCHWCDEVTSPLAWLTIGNNLLSSICLLKYSCAKVLKVIYQKISGSMSKCLSPMSQICVNIGNTWDCSTDNPVNHNERLRPFFRKTISDLIALLPHPRLKGSRNNCPVLQQYAI